MEKRIHKFDNFLKSINENSIAKGKGEAFMNELISKLSSELILDKDREGNFKLGYSDDQYQFIRVSAKEILTDREVPGEIYSLLKEFGYKITVIKKRWDDELYVLKPKDNWGYLVLRPNRRRLELLLLLNGEDKFLDFYDEDADERLLGYIWNGKKIIKVNFEGQIWQADSPGKEYSYGEYDSVKSEDNKKYEVRVAYTGDDLSGYEFVEVEDFRRVE